jgi:hypothetical protein
MGVLEEMQMSNKKRLRLMEFIKNNGIVFDHVKLSSHVESEYLLYH